VVIVKSCREHAPGIVVVEVITVDEVHVPAGSVPVGGSSRQDVVSAVDVEGGAVVRLSLNVVDSELVVNVSNLVSVALERQEVDIVWEKDCWGRRSGDVRPGRETESPEEVRCLLNLGWSVQEVVELQVG
jgi:hypothetical protein